MPTISSFYGIIILMHLTSKEHNPPHIHANTENMKPFSILKMVKYIKESSLKMVHH